MEGLFRAFWTKLARFWAWKLLALALRLLWFWKKATVLALFKLFDSKLALLQLSSKLSLSRHLSRHFSCLSIDQELLWAFLILMEFSTLAAFSRSLTL